MAAPFSLFLSLLSLYTFIVSFTSTAAISDRIKPGFSATPDVTSLSFQPILTDPTSTFSLGFLPLNSTHLHLSIVHLPSSFPLWRPPTPSPLLTSSTSLTFNGTLVLSDPLTNLLWSTGTSSLKADGALLLLLPSSNLQLLTSTSAVLWQSFDFPSDTLVQNQNLTSSLTSPNNQFSMSLGPNYLALRLNNPAAPIYWKQTANEAKAQIVHGQGPLYARVDTTGFLGLYQAHNPLQPVDVIPFDTFNQGNSSVAALRRLTLDDDGNIKAYYWSGSGSGGVFDYVAIEQLCDLPDPCGT